MSSGSASRHSKRLLSPGGRISCRTKTHWRAVPASRGKSTFQCATLYPREHLLHCQSILEVGMERRAALERDQEIRQRRDEGVLVADDVAGLPEVGGVGVVRTRYQQAAAALLVSRVGGVEEIQTVQVFEVESHHALRPVDIEGLAVLASNRVARGLEAAYAAVGEARKQQG